MTPPLIRFEDDYLMILDKPIGWITNSSNTTKDQPVVEDWLAKNFKFEIFEDPLLRHGIVHRLDKETSGLLVVAKKKMVFENLQEQFKLRKISKKYIALVHGLLKPEKGVIKVSVGRLPWRRDRFGIIPDGRDSETSYEVISYYQGPSRQYPDKFEKYSLVRLLPKTGRTHQIRIHLKFQGHPIVGDVFYAGRKRSRMDRQFLDRMFLDATYLSFTHPVTGKQLIFEKEMSDSLKGGIEKLSKLD